MGISIHFLCGGCLSCVNNICLLSKAGFCAHGKSGQKSFLRQCSKIHSFCKRERERKKTGFVVVNKMFKVWQLDSSELRLLWKFSGFVIRPVISFVISTLFRDSGEWGGVGF